MRRISTVEKEKLLIEKLSKKSQAIWQKRGIAMETATTEEQFSVQPATTQQPIPKQPVEQQEQKQNAVQYNPKTMHTFKQNNSEIANIDAELEKLARLVRENINIGLLYKILLRKIKCHYLIFWNNHYVQAIALTFKWNISMQYKRHVVL